MRDKQLTALGHIMKRIRRLQMNIKYNPSFGQITGLQKKMDMIYIQELSSQITHDNRKTGDKMSEGTKGNR
jgi:hypothetical protein